MSEPITQQQLHQLAELGILRNAKPGHVLECHAHRGDIGWHYVRTIKEFLGFWPHKPKLIENPRSDIAYVALINEHGLHVFEGMNGAEVSP